MVPKRAADLRKSQAVKPATTTLQELLAYKDHHRHWHTHSISKSWSHTLRSRIRSSQSLGISKLSRHCCCPACRATLPSLECMTFSSAHAQEHRLTSSTVVFTVVRSNSPSTGRSIDIYGAAKQCTFDLSLKPTSTSENQDSKGYALPHNTRSHSILPQNFQNRVVSAWTSLERSLYCWNHIQKDSHERTLPYQAYITPNKH